MCALLCWWLFFNNQCLIPISHSSKQIVNLGFDTREPVLTYKLYTQIWKWILSYLVFTKVSFRAVQYGLLFRNSNHCKIIFLHKALGGVEQNKLYRCLKQTKHIHVTITISHNYFWDCLHKKIVLYFFSLSTLVTFLPE